MRKTTLATLILLAFWSCTNENKPSQNAIPTENRNRTTAPDSLVIDVDSTGHIVIGNKVVVFDNMTQTITDTLKAIKTATGELPDTIVLRTKGEVLMGIRSEIRTSIEEAKTAMKQQ
jgi:biopolymer transport protein ExbD